MTWAYAWPYSTRCVTSTRSPTRRRSLALLPTLSSPASSLRKVTARRDGADPRPLRQLATRSTNRSDPRRRPGCQFRHLLRDGSALAPHPTSAWMVPVASLAGWPVSHHAGRARGDGYRDDPTAAGEALGGL